MTSDKLESFLEELGPTENIARLYRKHGLSYGWLAIITISIANVVSLLTGTMINVAIPEIMGAYGIGQDKAQWLSTGFLASSTVSMLFLHMDGQQLRHSQHNCDRPVDVYGGLSHRQFFTQHRRNDFCTSAARRLGWNSIAPGYVDYFHVVSQGETGSGDGRLYPEHGHRTCTWP